MNIHFQKPRCSAVLQKRDDVKRQSGSRTRVYAWNFTSYTIRRSNCRSVPLHDRFVTKPRRKSSIISLKTQDGDELEEYEEELSTASTQPTLASTTTGIEDKENRDDKHVDHATSRHSCEGGVGREDIRDTIIEILENESLELSRQLSDDELTQDGSFDEYVSASQGNEDDKAFITPERNPTTPQQYNQDTGGVTTLLSINYTTPIRLQATRSTRRVLPSDSFWEDAKEEAKEQDDNHNDNEKDLPCNENAFQTPKQDTIIKPIWRERTIYDGAPPLPMRLNYFPNRDVCQRQLPYFPFDEMITPSRSTDSDSLSFTFIQELDVKPLVPDPILGYDLSDQSISNLIATPISGTPSPPSTPRKDSSKSSNSRSNTDNNNPHYSPYNQHRRLPTDHDQAFIHNMLFSLVDEEDDEKTTSTAETPTMAIMEANHNSWPHALPRKRLEDNRCFQHQAESEILALHPEDEDVGDDEEKVEHTPNDAFSQAPTVSAANRETVKQHEFSDPEKLYQDAVMLLDKVSNDFDQQQQEPSSSNVPGCFGNFAWEYSRFMTSMTACMTTMATSK